MFPGGASGKEMGCQCRGHKRSREDPLEEEMATHSSILSWGLTEKHGGLWSMGSQRVRHDWSDLAHIQLFNNWFLSFCYKSDHALNSRESKINKCPVLLRSVEYTTAVSNLNFAIYIFKILFNISICIIMLYWADVYTCNYILLYNNI